MHSTQHYGAGRAPVPTGPDAEVTIVDGEAGSVDAQSPFERGESLGRYMVLETLGHGGMGVVLAAYDAKLDRRVALKLLRPHANDPDNHTRLLREAQALAKLSHSSVVAVYDVGELREQVFIAMEFIDGPNLRRWAHQEKRSVAQILAVFKDAGRGLQAAHDAGVVHRDFKPDNVLIGSDGRARVTDFGLALEAHLAAPPSSRADETIGAGRLTEAGMVMGTPAYMPIEQHVGHVTDHRSDQFAFCVSLYEALYGIRPFSGNTANEYCLSIRKGQIPPPPAGVKVSRRVHRAVVKGLASKPESRHPSMYALIRALTPRTRARRTWVLGGIGGLAIGAAAVAALPDDREPCRSFDTRIEEVYDADDRARIAEAFETVDLPLAEHALGATTAALDDYAERWVDAAHGACLAAEHGEQSTHMLDLRMHCLDRARSKLEATVAVLRDADDAVVRTAESLAASQYELALCDDLDVLERTSILPADSQEAAHSDALFQILDRVEILRAAGRRDEAKMLYAESEARFEASTYVPVQGKALWARGRILGSENDADQAIALFEKAHLLALEHGLDELGANAASSLGFYYLEFRTDLGQSEHYLGVAEALAEASGSSRAEAAVAGNLSKLRIRQGRLDDALEAAQREVDLAENDDAPSDRLIAEARMSLIYVILQRDGPNAALEPLQLLREFVHERLGTTHPLLSQLYSQLAVVRRLQGDPQQAYVHSAAALDQARSAFGENSLDAAYGKLNLAVAIGDLGRSDEALTIYREVDAVFIDELGRDHPVRAALLNNMASIHNDRGDQAAVDAAFEEALRILEVTSEGPNDRAIVLRRNIALHDLAAGRREQAQARATASLEEGRALWGEDHMENAVSLSALGQVALAQGRYSAARGHLRRAIEIGHDRPTQVAVFEFHLGRALADDPEATELQRSEGASLVRSADQTLCAHADVEGIQEEVAAWLQENGAEP